MLKTIGSILLAAAVLIPTPQSAHAITTSKDVFKVSRVLTEGGATFAEFTDEKGAMRKMPGSQLSNPVCSVYLGVNLALCLTSCDGSQRFLLTNEPDYGTSWTQLERILFTGERPNIQVAPATLRLQRTRKLHWDFRTTETWQLIQPEPSQSKEVPAYCPVDSGNAFDGEKCQVEFLSQLVPDVFLANYADTLTELSLSGNLASSVNDALYSLARLARELEQGLQRLDRTEFLTGGALYATNFKNFPTLYCQLKARKAGVSYSDSALSFALEQNKKELRDSLEFIERVL